MGTPTYTALANVTLGSSASSVTFSSISQAYRDLVLVVNGTTSGAGLTCNLRFNADSGSNYSGVIASGSGSATASVTYSVTALRTDQAYAGTSNTGNTNYIFQIMDYTATDKHKSVLLRMDNSSNGTDMSAHRWASTSAISTILVTPLVGTFSTGMSLALYGVSA